MFIKKIFYTIIFLLFCVNICIAGNTKQSSYINWLQKNNAWEVLNNKLRSLPPSEENVLTRANYLLRMNQPGKSLQVLQENGKFSSNASEANRLFLMAGIYRQNRNHYPALENYASAGKLISNEKYRKKLQNEQNIGWYWKTVWKKNFWEDYAVNASDSNSLQDLLQIAKLARKLWPEDDFWQNINRVLLNKKADNVSESNPSRSGLKISPGTRNKTVQALLATATGNMNKGKDILQTVKQQEIKHMWGKTLSSVFNHEILKNPTKSSPKDLNEQYPKYRAFQEYILPILEKQSPEIWSLYQPNTSSWVTFNSRIKSLDPDKALEKIKTELNSSLLNQDIENALKKYAFIYAVLAEDYPEAKYFWDEIDSNDKCLGLDLAGYILGYSPSFSQERFLDKVDYPYLNQLSLILKNSLYSTSASDLHTQFWVKEFKKSESQTAKSLDLLYNYSLHRYQWSKKQSLELAKTISLLYPMSASKNKACIWLAKRGHENDDTNKAWEYLQEIEGSVRLQDTRIEYLNAKAGLLMELGHRKKSLNIYKRLLEIDPQGITAEKKLNLALLSQKLDQWEWAQNILRNLWEDKEKLSKELKAETLFWLGEGAKNKGNTQKAKDYYFRLAWKYPQQHMWALTALHRAAMICKSQGQLFTAKNILQKVQKEAQQESQKKQAKKELSRIEEQIREQQQTAGTSLLY